MHRRQFLMAMSGAIAAAAARPARAADAIRIGYFGPLTGNFSQTGKDMTDGFNLFWEEVGNKVAGREVKVIVEDSDPEPTGALTKVRRLVEQEKVHTVAGGLLAATGYAIAPYIEQNKIPTVYPMTAPDDITQRKPVRWVVRTSASGSQATHPLGGLRVQAAQAAAGGDHQHGLRVRLGDHRRLPARVRGAGRQGGAAHLDAAVHPGLRAVPGVPEEGHRRRLRLPHRRPVAALPEDLERHRPQGHPARRHGHPHRRERAQGHGRRGARRHHLADLQQRARHPGQPEVLGRLREALRPRDLALLRAGLHRRALLLRGAQGDQRRGREQGEVHRRAPQGVDLGRSRGAP